MTSILSDVGQMGVMLAFGFATAGAALSFSAGRANRPDWAAAGRRALAVSFAGLSISCIALIFLILRGAFHLQYVWAHANLALPLPYKIAALWGGQEGSLLFWSWVLALYAVAVSASKPEPRSAFHAYLLFVLMSVLSFFLALNLFGANAFDEQGFRLPNGMMHPVFPRDGKGLNPLLQHPAMMIHPPILYLGYVGWAVPFAHAMAALLARAKGTAWIAETRAWAMTAWIFQGVGILLGARWAYVELGWGGYWGWDPVENASLMPWLCGTAFLHSVMVQERRGMLKLWNMILAVACFLLAITGTFLTRSGVVSSVHAFAQSSIGTYFVVFLALASSLSAILIFSRRGLLKPEARVESVVSRESSFLFNNVLFVSLCFAVLWGTIFPVFSEWLTGQKMVLGPPYFDTVTVPLALLLLFLMGVGPLVAWRRSSVSSLKRNFSRPLLLGALAGGLAFAFGMRHGYALISTALLVFVTSGIALEFYGGVRARIHARRISWRQAAADLVFENTRRWGGYTVHLAMVLLFVGFTGAAFDAEARYTLGAGERAAFGRYSLESKGIERAGNENFISERVRLTVLKNGSPFLEASPERRFYISSEQDTSEVVIRSSWLEDLYLVYAGKDEKTGKAIVQAYRNPLVSYIWVGGFVLIFGTLIAMSPSRRPRASQAASREPRRAGAPVEDLVLQ